METSPLRNPARWREGWDRQQERCSPDREACFAMVADLVAACWVAPRVLDLACGLGSMTERLLAGLPNATVTAVDLDPVLLRLARETFAEDERVTVVERDVRADGWSDDLPGAPFDAVVTTRALHWLDEPVLRRTYEEIAALLPPVGVFVNADAMPLERVPVLYDAVLRVRQARVAVGSEDTWNTWWVALADDEDVEAELAERWRRFGSNVTARFVPSEQWHLETLRKVGFSEAAVVWRAGHEAAVAAIR
jgi:SAM-dependent methyltransferase